MEYNIVNRKKDIQELETRYNSNKPEFVAIYGRKRLILDNSSKKTIVHNVLIITFGIQKREYWGDFTQVITLDDLFIN